MKQLTFLLFSLTLVPFTIVAQQNDTLRFTLMEAVEYAVINNPQLKSVKLDELNNQFKIKEVQSSALPQISGSLGGTDNFQRATQLLPGEIIGKPGTTVPIQFGTRYVYNGGVQLNQAIFNPSLNIGLKAAKQSQGLYELQTFKTKEELIYSVINLYVNLQMIEKQQELIIGNMDRTKKLLDITTIQFKEGVIKKVDVDQLQISYTNLETQLSSITNNAKELINNMKFLMNIDVSQEIELLETGLEHLPVSNQLLLGSNSQLNILDKQISLQELNTKNIRAGYLPTVSLAANYGRQVQSNLVFGNSAAGFSSGYYSLNVSIPIFDSGTKKNKVSQSNTALRQLQLNRNYLESDIKNQFKTASNTLDQNQKVIAAQALNMKLAEDLYDVAKLSYTEGISALSELINAENGLRESQSQYLTAMLQMNQAELKMMQTSGQLSELIKSGTNK